MIRKTFLLKNQLQKIRKQTLFRTYAQKIHVLKKAHIIDKAYKPNEQFKTIFIKANKSDSSSNNNTNDSFNDQLKTVQNEDEAITESVLRKEEKSRKIKMLSLKNLKLVSVCLIASVFVFVTSKKVPSGYVCLLENKNDETVLPYIYDDKMTFFYNPFKYKIVLMRIFPIKKKYSNVYETLDKKKIQILLEVKMKPKIPFIIEIYKSFGSNYSSIYTEREMNLDIKNVVNSFNYATFFTSDTKENEKSRITVDDIIDQIMDRFYDSSIFYKIILLDVSLSFERVE